MLRKEQSDLLTRTGPDTPMGRVFRSYWIPALLAEELPENDCPPVRVKLLSERMLAFRDTDGRYGLRGRDDEQDRADLASNLLIEFVDLLLKGLFVGRVQRLEPTGPECVRERLPIDSGCQRPVHSRIQNRLRARVVGPVLGGEPDADDVLHRVARDGDDDDTGERL